MKPRIAVLAAITSFTLIPMQANAASDAKWNGYLNTIGSISNSETEYDDDISENSTFSKTNFGLAVSKRINSKLSIAGQLHGEKDAFNFDWGYANYRISDALTAKAGKMKYPGALYTDTLDIGTTYPWVTPPISIYGDDAGLAFEAYTGTGLAYTGGDDTELGAEFYLGETSDIDSNHKRMLGLVLSAATDEIRAQLAVNNSIMEFEEAPAAGSPQALMIDQNMTIINLGLQAEYDFATIYYEYGQTTMSGLPQMDRSGWYVTISHAMEDWTPHFTYQTYEGMQGLEESSVILGMNKQLSNAAVFKMELQQLEPVNGGFFEAQPSDDKVTIVNVSLNMTF